MRSRPSPRLRASLSGLLGLAAAGAVDAPGRALAGPSETVTSAADLGAPMGARVDVDYGYEVDTARITREDVGPGANPLGAPPRAHELDYRGVRHTITPRLELGLYHDAWFAASLPVVVSQTGDLSLASSASRTSAGAIADGLVPAAGFDADDPGTGLPTSAPLLFRGTTRSGLDQVHLGLGIAPMSQRRDDTKPTWRLGADLRLSIGKVQRFDRVAPSEQTGVASGVHELRLWTSVTRTIGWAAPWFEAHWQVPLASTSDSLFQDPGFGATNTTLAQQAGVSFGVEAFAVDRPADHLRVAVDLGGHLAGHFEGRAYSELWELFAYAGDTRVAGNPLILDADPLAAGVQGLSHPGISNIENFLETGLGLAVRGDLGPHVRFSAFGDLTWRTAHAISFADAGIDRPTCTATRTTACETAENDLVNPGTSEVNPLHVDLIDLVGHRYRSEHGLGIILGVQAQAQF